MKAILLLSDEPETKEEKIKVEQTDLFRKFFDLLPWPGSRDWYRYSEEVREAQCFCVRNNALDRAKILIRYLRKRLLFEKDQIILLRFSKFPDADGIIAALEGLFKNSSEDFLLYYTGHGISGKPTGWSDGGKRHVYYYKLSRVFEAFRGRLIFINDCCHALSVNPYLQELSGRYLLFGASRPRMVCDVSILDSVLGFWIHRRIALPRVQFTARWKEYRMDIPAFCVRGNYYNCNCGNPVTDVRGFKPNKMPSLRRGAELDYLLFPKIAGL